MIIKIDMNIPPHFFESANHSNGFESVSERVAKAFISQILREKNVRRGNPEIREPDYISDSNSFEVTFAIANSIVPQLKGVIELNKAPFDIQNALIEDILNASQRKSKKTYSTKPILFLITMSPLIEWYYPFYTNENYFSQIGWQAKANERDELFDYLYLEYIKKGIFKNILIVQPTHDEHFVLFDIKAFGSYSENTDCMTKIGVINTDALPVCKVRQIKNQAKNNNKIIYEISIINYIN